MRILFLILLAGTLSGCAELHEHALGTRVHSFNARGVDYVHCSILMDRAKPQLAHDSIEMCRDEVSQPASPQKK